MNTAIAQFQDYVFTLKVEVFLQKLPGNTSFLIAADWDKQTD